MLSSCVGQLTARCSRKIVMRDAVPVSEVTSLRPMSINLGLERSRVGRRRHVAVPKAVQAQAKETKGAETVSGSLQL